jgi:hypothetical protein
MMHENNLETKVDKITFVKLVESGVPSNAIGLIFQKYQQTYGKRNVWSDANALYIKTIINKSTEGAKC